MSKTVTQTVALLGSIALAGCNKPRTLYQWEGYQTRVHEYFKDESKEVQAQALGTDLEKTRAKSGTMPPGYHVQLELLYSSIGKDDQMVHELETEKALSPESATYIGFLLSNARGDAR